LQWSSKVSAPFWINQFGPLSIEARFVKLGKPQLPEMTWAVAVNIHLNLPPFAFRRTACLLMLHNASCLQLLAASLQQPPGWLRWVVINSNDYFYMNHKKSPIQSVWVSVKPTRNRAYRRRQNSLQLTPDAWHMKLVFLLRGSRRPSPQQSHPAPLIDLQQHNQL
jgi:hypothetical protein